MNNNIVVDIDFSGSYITAAPDDLQAQRIICDALIRRYINAKGDKNQIMSLFILFLKK